VDPVIVCAASVPVTTESDVDADLLPAVTRTLIVARPATVNPLTVTRRWLPLPAAATSRRRSDTDGETLSVEVALSTSFTSTCSVAFVLAHVSAVATEIVGASSIAVTRMANETAADESAPPLAVPPSSTSRVVTVAVPLAFGAGVNVSTPSADTAGAVRNSVGLVFVSTMNERAGRLPRDRR
jgi:hypothetical protein